MDRQVEQSERVPHEREIEAPEPASGVDLGRVRDLILAANPDVIPELVAGDSFEALMASVEPAKEAYQNVAQRFQQQPQGQQQPTAVPAGQPLGRQYVINIEELSLAAKIAEGLRRRSARK
jgi:hypothetical protein